MISFETMATQQKLLHFRTAIEIVLKKLRYEKDDVSQAKMNTDFAVEYGFTLNMGRTETKTNFTIITFYYICDYFKISPLEFFEMVNKITSAEITEFLKEKKNRVKRR
jgi:hypothetical protein